MENAVNSRRLPFILVIVTTVIGSLVITSHLKETVDFQTYQGEFSTSLHKSFTPLWYTPSSLEKYMYQHSVEYGFDKGEEEGETIPDGCKYIMDEFAPTFSEAREYSENLLTFSEKQKEFTPIGDDLRKLLFRSGKTDEEKRNICKSLDLITDTFKDGQLSATSFARLEPMLPPMRHPLVCDNIKHLFDLDYMIHDFSALCFNLKPHSRIVFVDMGASLQRENPVPGLIALYEKFGFKFDHIYAYEILKTDTEVAFGSVPDEWMSKYHWINMGVDPDPEGKFNPLKMIADKFNEDDLVVVKLDVDTHDVELPLVDQLLTDDKYKGRIIDQFYFEHHVKFLPMSKFWTKAAKGTLKESLDIFAGLRERGIGAHSYV